MATSQIELENQTIELSEKAFKTFCNDIIGMFGVKKTECSRQQVCNETIEGLKKHFNSVVAVNSVKAEGTLDGTFHLIFDREGLFILAGVVTMPDQMSSLCERYVAPKKILEHIKSGSLKEAQEMSDALAQAGNMLVGAWDRVFREELDGHFAQSNLFIGKPWDEPEEKIGLASSEKVLFISMQMSIGAYPPFDCGVIFPRILFGPNLDDAEADAEATARVKAEAEAKTEAEAKAEPEAAEAKGKPLAEIEERAKAEAESRHSFEVEERVGSEAEARVKAEKEAQAEQKTKAYGEALARAEEKANAETKARAEAQAKEEAETETKEKPEVEVEEKLKVETEAAEKAEAEAKTEAEEKAEAEAAKAEAEAERKAKAEAEEKARAEAKEKPVAETDEKVSDAGESVLKEEPKSAAEETTEEKTEEKAQYQEAAVEKAASGEYDTTPKSDSEKSKPQEPITEKAPAEQTIATEDAEQAVETDKAETAEKVGDANESAVKEEPEAAAEKKAEDVDIDASDKIVEEKVATTDESEEQPVSETIRRTAQSPAELPDDPAIPAMTENAVLSSNADGLSVMCAKDIMQEKVTWAGPNDSVQQTLKKMQQHNAGYIMVGQDGVPEGIISKSDITGAVSPYLRPVFAKWRGSLDDATLQIRIKWIMSRPVHTIGLETSLAAIMENMRQFGARCLPVVDQQGKVKGLVTVFDIFKVLYNNPNISTAGKVPQASPLA